MNRIEKGTLAIGTLLVMLALATGSASAGCIGVETGTDYECGETVTESCTFNGNLTCPSLEHGLIVGANNIVIEGAAFKITGNENADACMYGGEQSPQDVDCGILNVGYDNVVIKNLEIENFCTGIGLKGTGANPVVNNTIDSCKIHDNGNDTVGGNFITHGIHICYASDSTISNNDIYNNTGTGGGCFSGGNGIFFYAGMETYANNVITNNELHDNRKGGFLTKMKLHYAEITHNHAYRNGQGGIILRCKLSDENLIEFNNASGNYGDGMFIGGNRNIIRNNNVNDNIAGFKIGPSDIVGDGDGINFGRSDGSHNNKLYNNTVCGNEGTDIDTYGAGSGTTGDNNTCDTCSNYHDEGEICCSYDCPGEIGCVAEDGTVFGCGDTVTKSCTFNGSMECPSGDGLIIGADNITIDGAGYILDGVNSACTGGNIRCGILNEGYDNVAIKNLEVKNFCFGIRLRGTSSYIENNTIENCNIHHNGNATCLVATHGIKMEYVFNSTIMNNSIHHTIAHVDSNPGCEDGGNGLFLYKGDYNIITQNEFYDNTKGGFFIKMMPMYNNISYNDLWGNGQGGIILRCMKSSYNLIEHNNASDNYGSGIFIGGNNNTVRYNTVCNNRNGGPYYEDIGVGGRGYGINIGRSDGSCYNKLYENKVCENDYKDIYIVSGVIENHGDENTCDTTYNYNDEGTTGCTYNCGGNPGCVAADGTVYRCGDTVMKSCTFNGNMTCPAGKGLVVGADDITIDGIDFTLDGVSPGTCEDFNRAGISGTTMSTRDNMTIKNLKVKNFCCGIYLEGFGTLGTFTNVTIDNCTIYDNGVNVTGKKTHGIKMTFAYNSVIKNCEIYNNTGGLGCTPPCENGGSGIFVYAGDYNLITQNVIYNNRKCGYFTKAKPTYTNITNNTLWGNGQGGIVLRCKACEYNLIEHNNASYNYGVGIFIGGPRNTIRNNLASYNKNGSLTGLPGTLHGGGGINIGRSDGSFENELYDNTVCGNEYLDIHVCLECTGNTGDDNACDTTYNYDDTGTTGCTYSCPSIAQVFDTGKGTYPSIFGTHKGKIIPDRDITVNRMYTYPCEGTGGHTEHIRIWNSTLNVTASWNGYKRDWHNISFKETFTLKAYETYNYTIRTGSYPQIVNAREYKAVEGGNITCEEFVDANGKRYEDWIPAIRLYL